MLDCEQTAPVRSQIKVIPTGVHLWYGMSLAPFAFSFQFLSLTFMVILRTYDSKKTFNFFQQGCSLLKLILRYLTQFLKLFPRRPYSTRPSTCSRNSSERYISAVMFRNLYLKLLVPIVHHDGYREGAGVWFKKKVKNISGGEKQPFIAIFHLQAFFSQLNMYGTQPHPPTN